MKYDRIVESSQNRSRQKIAIAKKEINRMLERREKVTVAALVRYTGLSEGFFYKNKEIRKILDEVILMQGASYNPKKVIIDKVMEENILNLKLSVRMLKKEKELLERKNQELTEQNNKLQREIELINKR